MPLTIAMTAAGIPCKVKVFRYEKHRGNMSRFAQDPDEYYGWTELDYQILDRKGYRADWLRNKLDKEGLVEEFERDLQQELDDYYEGLREDLIDATGLGTRPKGKLIF